MLEDTDDDLTTRTGFRFHVRQATPQDEAMVAGFFTHVTPEDIRFRFLSGMKTVSHERLVALTRVDDPRVVNFLAFSPNETLLAVAMLAAGDDPERGEVALTIRDDFKHQGISWEMLEHICRYAERHNFKSIESLESRANHAAIDLERDMEFQVFDDEDDPTVVVLRRDLKLQPDAASIDGSEVSHILR
ncbi:GNAT family N-acetyltransferase [Rhizobium sp. Root1204]|uniref:GNAT family N-acetyltransferase n=1 Tax=Rhizobium sp. Root1204 TaxID=1736428 RepID=UPI0007148EA3|nr:GNAT family N-acetyltransferase [Rhizobium sp. Root1204]KQV36667.1 GCN5 family acetyltransferase [Rhizobium sp. Root1204]